LEIGAFQLPAAKPGYGTLGHQLNSFQFTFTGLSPSMAGLSRPLQLHRRGGSWTHNPTSPTSFLCGIRFGLFPFRSLLLRESHLVSFPPPTEMLQFRGFPLPSGSTTVPQNRSRRSHSGIPGSTAAYAYPGLFRGWPRPSSALKPSHPPDGVLCRAFWQRLFGVCGEPFACAWCHYELLQLIFTLHSSLLMASCIHFMASSKSPKYF
jgi:hypothetical protein